MTKSEMNTQRIAQTKLLENRAHSRTLMRLIATTVAAAFVFVSWSGLLLVSA